MYLKLIGHCFAESGKQKKAEVGKYQHKITQTGSSKQFAAHQLLVSFRLMFLHNF